MKQTIIITPLLVLLLVSCATVTDEQIRRSAEKASADATQSYVIGPGDILNISVWKEEDMQKEVLVKPDGGITFPLVGELKAGGYTTEQLKDVLTKKLKHYIPNPVVTVSVINSQSNKIYIIGKVNRPGEYITTNYTDVLQALSLAGGLNAFADESEIKIIRRAGKNKQVFEFDYDDVVSGDRLDMNIVLKPGDTIVVP